MEIQTTHRSDNTILVFSGSLNEKANFPKVTKDFSKEIIVDLNELTTVNSLGIQRWIDWTKTLPASHHLSLINCPQSIVMQINMVDNFLPENSDVRSVMVPFYCNTHDVEFCEKYLVGEDVDNKTGHLVIHKKVTSCPKNENCAVDFDIHGEKYFRFLTKSS